MAATYLSSCHNNAADDEDYIDMEVSSTRTLLCSSPQNREFEFQMYSSSVASNDAESSTTSYSPADELFYKGKLLPLYLPPRLRMVQTLLLQGRPPSQDQEHSTVPFITSSFTAPSTNPSTPLDSCNISPSESCRVSCELNPSEYFFEWSTTEFSSFISSTSTNPKKSNWSKKLKMMRQSSIITQKLKASRAYLKSLFSKSACSDDESSANAACNSESRDCPSKYFKVGKKNPFGRIGRPYPNPSMASYAAKHIEKLEGVEENIVRSQQHRRSFSGAIKRHSISPSKCLSSSSSSSSSSGASSSSSSFSINSNLLYESHFLKRSSSAASDIEISIESAIAHCRSSQQQKFDSRNPQDEARFYSILPTSKIARPTDENQEKTGVCKV